MQQTHMPKQTTSNIMHLQAAESPAKADIIKLIDEVRAEVERGEVLALVLIPIHPDEYWSTRSAGDIGMLKLSGVLGRAWLSSMQAVDVSEK